MNQIAPVAPVAPGAGSALIPTSVREAMDLATMMAKGKLVPAALQGSPADCLLVIEQAMRWGMSPFAVAQEVSVIQGKLMHSGKIVAAAVQSCGILSGRLRYDYSGEGDALAVTVSGTLRGETEPRSVTVRLRDARTNNQHWAKSPEQMLAYHAARVWARRYAPEVMLGVYSPEEFDTPPAAEPIPPARGPVVEHEEPQREPEWRSMQWPICDRSGRCRDLGDPDAWEAEMLRRIEVIQTNRTLDAAMKPALIRQVRDANRAVVEWLCERGYAERVEGVVNAFRAALGEAETAQEPAA